MYAPIQHCACVTTWKMEEVKQAVHRPGPLKQQNKSHKHGKHRSKGEILSEAKGEL